VGNAEYFSNNEIEPSCEEKIISYIENHVKINPLGTIDWSDSPDAILMENVTESVFSHKLKEMLESLGSDVMDVYFIVQADNAFPSLKTRMDCWLVNFNNVFCHDTVFLSADGRRIIHYDFYGNLWGKIIAPENNKILSE